MVIVAADEVILVTDEDTIETAQQLTRLEGLLVEVSSGANTWPALQLAKRLSARKTGVTVLPDTVERYLNTSLPQFYPAKGAAQVAAGGQNLNCTVSPGLSWSSRPVSAFSQRITTLR